ncbi:Glutaminyl cyclase, putative isoform 1 [Hibiscus syriacus]|uniref:non-specific serine/threonine protein kinase n=1 Tax=Hibiscus syriacus TaxID=106335 RepID=A0A6A2Y184_HIBSY|nr:Glutaminyl cyclase, putative isoform 1 [Hibiscus syriacus]
MNTTEPELEAMFPDQWSTRAGGTTTPRSYLPELEHFQKLSHGVPETRTSYRFSSRYVDVFTDGFSYDNLIGNGNYGVVHRGVLFDGTTVAVKRLLSNSCQPEVFVTEVEAIGHVRHKNLVKLLGYCMEEGYRMLVYEYVNNSNLHQWLHGPLGHASPLTWTIRMNIIHRIAKGYAAQDNATISKWDKKSDVYSFGILVMEIVSGRIPVDHDQHQIYLIDWLKSMVANKKIADVVDPRIPEIPSMKELKRIKLIALRCVDPDIDHRPTMGEVIHMLEPRNMLLSDDHFVRRAAPRGGKPDTRTHDDDASDV